MSDPQSLLSSARAALEGVTEGPWRNYTPNPRHNSLQVVESEGLSYLARSRDIAEGVRQPDAEFIAIARTLVPDLVSALEGAEERIAAVLELHEKLPTGLGYSICSVCSDSNSDGNAVWPCATVRALGGGDTE